MTRHTLYRFWDAGGRLLYVGITHHPDVRWRSHKQRDWWTEVAQITLETHASREAVLVAEKEAIRAEQPAYNVVYNRQPAATLNPSGQPFSAWLRRQERRDDPVGDLARDVITDRVKVRAVSELRERLEEAGACANALEALSRAEAEWLAPSDPEPPLTAAEHATIRRSLSTPGHFGRVL